MRRGLPFLLPLLLIAHGCGGSCCCDSDGSATSTDSAVCITRMASVHSALMLYTSDWDGVLPLSTGWMDTLTPYVLPRTIVFRCPAVEAANPAGYGFAMHSQISGQNVSSFAIPENVVTLFECASTAKNVSGTESLLPSPPRHGGKNTFARLDGSVRAEAP